MSLSPNQGSSSGRGGGGGGGGCNKHYRCRIYMTVHAHVMCTYMFLMRDEKEERKKQARLNKQTNKAKQHSTYTLLVLLHVAKPKHAYT